MSFKRLSLIVFIFVLPLLILAMGDGKEKGESQEPIATPTPAPTPEPTPALPEVDLTAPAAETGKDGWTFLRIVAVGDVNLNRNRVEVYPDYVDVWGMQVPWSQFFAGAEGMIDGDINFCNVETVITDRNDIPINDKAFCFRTHPNGARTILKAGFNLWSLANNHSFDYGAEGVYETLKNIALLEQESKFHWAGLGKDKAQAIRPAIFEVKGIRVGFTALGIGHAAGPNSPGVGQEYYYKEALSLLRDADVDFRILSCHDGKEGRSNPIDRQIRVYREAIRDFDVDLVIGHHPHVVHGIEQYRDGLIYYSLGNFMIRGAADMGKRANGKNIRDFGLFTRLDLRIKKGQGHKFERLEIVPVCDMHQGVHPFEDSMEAHARIETMNELSSLPALQVNAYGGMPRPTAAQGLVFQKNNGVGVYEFPETSMAASK